MKFNVAILFFVSQAAQIYSAAVPEVESVDALECGNLGVMTLSDADRAVGLNAADIRKCADHPLGRHRDLAESSQPPMDVGRSVPPELTAREGFACEYSAPYGCSKGYCWKVCGSGGEWCWTTVGNPRSAWKTCGNWRDCSQGLSCGEGVGCGSCGCSC